MNISIYLQHVASASTPQMLQSFPCDVRGEKIGKPQEAANGSLKAAIVYLTMASTWITVVTLKVMHASKPQEAYEFCDPCARLFRALQLDGLRLTVQGEGGKRANVASRCKR